MRACANFWHVRRPMRSVINSNTSQSLCKRYFILRLKDLIYDRKTLMLHVNSVYENISRILSLKFNISTFKNTLTQYHAPFKSRLNIFSTSIFRKRILFNSWLRQRFYCVLSMTTAWIWFWRRNLARICFLTSKESFGRGFVLQKSCSK